MGSRGRDALNLLELIVCPVHRTELEKAGDELVCSAGHRFPYVDGIPVLLTSDLRATHPVFQVSLERARAGGGDRFELRADEVDPVVQGSIAATGGLLYQPLQGHLTRYPIPELRLPRGNGKLLLDVGCHWGRWSIAAAQKGYRTIGIDPSLEGVEAARRIAKQLGLDSQYLVGDARQLPFRDDVFDVTFSNGVLQHFTRENVRLAVAEMSRVLKARGVSLVQMPNAHGLRSLFWRLRYRFWRGMPQHGFDIRYWTPGELEAEFEELVGPSRLEADCFFALNAQRADIELLPPKYQLVVRASEATRRVARVVRPLERVADSVYVRSTARA
jgi:SAM-dependent methyltransferase